MNNPNRGNKAVAIWIGVGVGMLLVQVILGGVTRLTGSGLSITEWNIITGILPPLNHQGWQTEFDKYRQTPQFQLLNIHFTISDFKFIFFWEWLHRFWARLIGIVFIIGFVYLLARRFLKKEMVKPLLILFLLGALQGAVGWLMVASGLTGDAVYVKPTKLALHFIFALGLISYAYWYLMYLLIPRHQFVISPRIKGYLWVMVVLITIQLAFGALMAGHKAAMAAPTWPDINGSMNPSTLFIDTPLAINFIDNKITIHFVHRTLAYVILLLTLVMTWRLYMQPKESRVFKCFRDLPLLLVVVQVCLGISALLQSRSIVPGHWGGFEWVAEFHQITGLMLLLSFLSLLFVVRRS
ncbi:MAG: COX15/CtaA family protein [Flavitalea sp.]